MGTAVIPRVGEQWSVWERSGVAAQSCNGDLGYVLGRFGSLETLRDGKHWRWWVRFGSPGDPCHPQQWVAMQGRVVAAAASGVWSYTGWGRTGKAALVVSGQDLTATESIAKGGRGSLGAVRWGSERRVLWRSVVQCFAVAICKTLAV